MSSAELYRVLRAWTQERFDGQVPVRIIIEMPTTVCNITLPPPGNDTPTTPEPAPKSSRSHSTDYRCVLWEGTVYEFTPMQARVVAQLWAAAEAGTPSVSQADLLERAESSCNHLKDLFKDSPAWGVVIVQAGVRGSYRLAE